MNLKKALSTITVILAVIAPGFLAVSAAIDNVSLNARAFSQTCLIASLNA
ncbi:MAG: hypothetical protein WCD81_02170 [Candidatus Bathyarchaeia archaeon]